MEIKNFRKINKPGSQLKASFTVFIPKWELSLKLTYFESPLGEKWFGYPSRQYINKDGQKKQEWLAYFSKEARDRFEGALVPIIAPMMESTEYDEPTVTHYTHDELPF